MTNPPWKGSFAAAFYAGLVVSAYFTIIVSVFSPDIAFWKEWQTLVSGFGAVLAGTLSVVAIYRQIAVSEAHETNRLRGLNLARRAAISVPLSNLTDIQESVLNKLTSFLDEAHNTSRFDEIFEFQKLPETDLNRFIDLLSVTEAPAAEDVSELISDIQLQISRLRMLASPLDDYQRKGATNRHNIEAYAVDAFIIWLRASRMFHYARREDEHYFDCKMVDALNSYGKIRVRQYSIENAVRARIEKAKRGEWLASRFDIS